LNWAKVLRPPVLNNYIKGGFAMAIKLYLTRHGETQANALGVYSGSTDVPLNETGIAQAHRLAEQLSDIKFDAIISSTMLRARHTAEIVCAKLNMEFSTNAKFVECNMGVYEGLTRDEARARYPDLWEKFGTRDPDAKLGGGESIREVCDRVDEGMRELISKYRDKTVLLVCHGFAARAVHRFMHNLTFEEMFDIIMNN